MGAGLPPYERYCRPHRVRDLRPSGHAHSGGGCLRRYQPVCIAQINADGFIEKSLLKGYATVASKKYSKVGYDKYSRCASDEAL